MGYFDLEQALGRVLVAAFCIFCLLSAFLLPIAAFGLVANWINGQVQVKD